MGFRSIYWILQEKKRASDLQELDLLIIENSYIRLTLKGSSLVDPIAAELV